MPDPARQLRRLAAALALLASPFACAANGDATGDADFADLAEHALRDGLPSLALPAATNALASATNAAERARAFTLVAAAQERLLPADELLAWLDAAPGAPADPAAYYRGRALAALGRHDEAAERLAALRSALPAESPLLGPVLRDLAYSLTAAGRPAEAAAALDPVRGEDPSLTLELGRLWLASGAEERAEALLAPLASSTEKPDLAAAAALLLARVADDETSVSNALSALRAAHDAGDLLSPDVQALVLAASAALESPGSGEPTEDAVKDARRAVDLAEGALTKLECQAELLVLLARRSEPGESFELARQLVASASRTTIVPASIRHAAAVMEDAGRPNDALEFCDLFVASFADDPGEAAVQRIRARSLSELNRHAEAAAAHLRAAEILEASGNGPDRLSSLSAAAYEQHRAGLFRQALATLETLRAADPPPSLRAEADLLSAECLAPIDTAAATEAFLAVQTNHPGTFQASKAVFQAAQLTAAAQATNGTDKIKEAIALFQRAAAPPLPQNAEAYAASIPADETAVSAMQAAAALSAALLQQQLGDYALSLASLEVAASTPDGGVASEQAAALRPATLLALGRETEALAAYSVFTNAYPASRWMPDALFWRASRAFNTGDYAQADTLFDSFANRFPGSAKVPHALYCRAVSLFRTQRHKEAIQTVEALAAAYPASETVPPARFVQAEALCQLLEFENAAVVFAHIAAGSVTPPDLALRAAVRRADCLFALGGDSPERYRDSLRAYREALAAPACEPAGLGVECRYKIGRSLERLGEADAALAQYYEEVIVPFEKAPSADAALWYSRAVFDAADILRRRENGSEADLLLQKIANSDYPRAEEARRLLSPAPAPASE